MNIISVVIKFLVIGGLLLLLLACEDQIVNECDDKDLESKIQLSKFSMIQKEVFDINCTSSGCHSGLNPPANLNLENGQSYSSLVEIDAELYPGEKRVVKFDSENSILIKILRGNVNPRMPLGRNPLNSSVIDSIAFWIDNGALNN